MEELFNYSKDKFYKLKERLGRIWSRGKWWYLGVIFLLLSIATYSFIVPQEEAEKNSEWLEEAPSQGTGSWAEGGDSKAEPKLIKGVAGLERAYPMESPFTSEELFKKRLQAIHKEGPPQLGDKGNKRNPKGGLITSPREVSTELVTARDYGENQTQSSAYSTKEVSHKPILQGILQGNEWQALISYGDEVYCLGQGQSQRDLFLERIEDNRVLLRWKGESLWYEL